MDKATEQIAEDGWVVPVRLALLAEMMKSREWRAATLQALGGERGVGVAFLEQTFDSALASPAHRRFRRAAESVLSELLPEDGVDLKGRFRSHDELLAASGMDGQPELFPQVIDILDRQLRLITPMEQSAPITASDCAGLGVDGVGATASFQLTHDYLVPAIREWLMRRKKQTRAGRAQLCLERRTRQWTPSREARYLPSLLESLQIWLFTRRGSWTEAQRTMLRRAATQHLGVAAAACLLVGGVTMLALSVGAVEPATVFLDAGRPVAERIAALDGIDLANPAALESVVRSLGAERDSAVLERGGRTLRQFAESLHAAERPENQRERELLGELASSVLDSAAAGGDRVNDAARAEFFGLLALVAPPDEAIDAAARQPAGDHPRFDEALSQYLAAIDLSAGGDREQAKATAMSLIRLLDKQKSGPVAAAASGLFIRLAPTDFVTLFLDAFSGQIYNEAEQSLGLYLGALDDGEAATRAAAIVDAMGARLKSEVEKGLQHRPYATTDMEYLLMSLRDAASFLTLRREPLVDDLTSIVAHPNDFRQGAVVDLACAAAAPMYLLPASGPGGSAGLPGKLRQLLADGEQPESVRAAAARALGLLADSESVQSLAAMATESSEADGLRLAALRGLGEAGRLRVQDHGDVGDIAAIFERLLTSEEFLGDSLVIEAVREFETFAPTSDFPRILAIALSQRYVGEGMAPWQALCEFLVRDPAEAQPIIEAFLEAASPLASQLFPHPQHAIPQFLREGSYDAAAIETAARYAIVALAKISAGHPDKLVRLLGSENLEAISLKLDLPAIDPRATAAARRNQLTAWLRAWDAVKVAAALGVNGQLEVR